MSPPAPPPEPPEAAYFGVAAAVPPLPPPIAVRESKTVLEPFATRTLSEPLFAPPAPIVTVIEAPGVTG